MRKLLIITLLLITTISFSQETKKDTLKTEEITVVKPYTPTILDAFKVKSNPSINEGDNFQKEKVNYSIFSIPVASTFTPSKGKARGLAKSPKERLYNNYVSAGFGNYMTPLFEAFLHSGDARFNDYGIFLNYHASNGGINDLLLDDNFSKGSADIYYKQFERDYNWEVNIGFNRNQYNYYGLPTDLTFEDDVIDEMIEKQVYSTVYLGGNVNFEEGVFERGTVEFINFSDFYKSNEIRFLSKSDFLFPISTEFIKTGVSLDFVSGNFDQNYWATNTVKHSFLNLGLHPDFEVLRDNLSINIGAKLYYTFDIENGSNQFKVYPNIAGSFKLVDDIFILVAGVTGDLIQNTYRDFANENPFVSPTLNIQQTDQQYKAYIGAKGKLASNVGYNFNVNYSSEKDKPLFVHNQSQTDGSTTVNNAYEAGNSFGLVYDDLTTINVFGEINFDISKEFYLEAAIEYFNYSTTNQLEAWNLPEIKAAISAEYKAENWYVGSKLFFRGVTKDFVKQYDEIGENGSIIKNKSYVDLNFNGGYIFSHRLTVFGKINNVVGENYHRFVNYPVQSIQFLAGLTYKFDL